MENQLPLIVDRRVTGLTFTFNNISKKNALNSEMMGAMTAAIEESSNYEELRAIVIRGEGSVFCSGADLNEWDPSQLQLLLRTIVDCSIPTIAEVHGACLGGGMGIDYNHNNSNLDLKKYSNDIEKFLKKNDCRIIFEPGRSIVGNSAILITKIIYKSFFYYLY